MVAGIPVWGLGTKVYDAPLPSTVTELHCPQTETKNHILSLDANIAP